MVGDEAGPRGPRKQEDGPEMPGGRPGAEGDSAGPQAGAARPRGDPAAPGGDPATPDGNPAALNGDPASGEARPFASMPGTLPREALVEAVERLLPPTAAGESVALVLVVRDAHVSVRELGAYLTLIDRLYGRLRPGGLRSYAQLASEQLRLRRIAADDTARLEIEEEVERVRPWRLAVLYLALKLLPSILDTGGRSWAEAFRAFQDGAPAESAVQVGLFAAADGSLRSRLEDEPALSGMRRPLLEQIAGLLEQLYASEDELVPAALRFAQSSVVDVTLAAPRG